MAPKLRVYDTSATLVDFGIVESQIRQHMGDGERSKAFARYVMASHFCISSEEFGHHLIDGGGDRGVDIIYIDHESRKINICSCKCVVTFNKSRKNFPGVEVDKIITFVEDILNRNETLLIECRSDLAIKIREIWSLFEDGECFSIEVHLFSNQLGLAEAERSRLANRLSHCQAKLFEHGLYQLSHGTVRAVRPSFKKKLRPEKDNWFRISDEGLTGWSVRVSLKNAFDFFSADEPTEFDERLIEENVRYFLGANNPANSEIRETLIAGRTPEFWALNNGLTIVCDAILASGLGNHPITLKNPKIVNGGQTAKIIHEVGAGTLSKFGNGCVVVKIIETADDELIERIAIASNTQSRISGRDLKAFDSFQHKLAFALPGLGYFYRRKRGEKPEAGSKPMIDMAKIGQILLAYSCGEPARSKTDSNDIFNELYHQVFDPAIVTPELIVAAHNINQEIEGTKAKALSAQRGLSRLGYDETWIIEGHYHLLFVVGELMRRNGIDLIDHHKGCGFIDEARQLIGRFVEKNTGRSAYRLFRSATTKGELVRLIEVVPSDGKAAVQLSFPF